jgi:hypothetical protein
MWRKVRRILKENSDIDINWRNFENKKLKGTTALHVACENGHKEAVSLLLEHPHIDVNSKNENNETPFACARNNNKNACISIMFGDERVLINQFEGENFSLLVSLFFDGHTRGIKEWISSGREICLGERGNAYNDVFGKMILQGREEAILLLKRFRENEKLTRYQVRLELGYFHKKAARYFALVIFLCDGLLKIKDPSSKVGRFFKISERLPIELQTILCHRLVDSVLNHLPAEMRENGFRELAKCLCRNK